MTNSTNASWIAIAIIVVIPALVIVGAEIDERLRQRESPYRPAVAVLRGWGLPFFALWALLGPVLDVDSDSFAIRVAASGTVAAVAVAVLRVFAALIHGYRDRVRSDPRRALPQLVLVLPRLLTILVAGWLLIDTVWGVDLSALFTALGVTSLVVSFALQDTLSGLASGLLLVSDQPFKPGDWISTGDTEGEVVDLSWRTARIRDRNGDVIVVPNSQLAGTAVVNHSAPDPRHRVVVSLQVAFANPPTLAIEMLLDAARGTEGVLADPPPKVLVTQIDDPLMGYDVHLWVGDYAIVPRVKSDFGRLVWYQSFRHDVPLPSPAQDLYLYDGVKVGEQALPVVSEMRAGLQRAPLMASLADDELDALAVATRPVRYAVGETIVEPGSSSGDLLFLREGHAQLVHGAGADQQVISEYTTDESIGIVDLSGAEMASVSLRAVADCVLLTVDAAAVANVGSRNADLAAALNRLHSIRRRRVERALELRASDPT